MNFFEKIGTFFDIIPKIVYFLSAAFMSAIDALQCLVRKLAGLDVYWVEGNAVAQQDPLSEFIYGILGYGNSPHLYKGLNTVFWSLAVFAIIALAITTMLAIIKSHYNEDTAGTSPWKYVYTAIKAVLTFGIIPFTVIIGMQFASWTLKTLDQITAGVTSEEQLVTLYGQQTAGVFQGDQLEGSGKDGTKYYSYYDFFGLGSVTSSTPFSGMLFKAASYGANRARANPEGAASYKEVKTNSGVSIFANTTLPEGSDDAAEFIATQIDFAFANNLHIKSNDRILATSLYNVGLAPYWSATDLINPLSYNIKEFSKWNVGLVWMFYNLWSYNFIVAFGCGATMLGLMLSIIIGLMSRLIKGAIMFLVYPALLGIAPLDNFKAFKGWGTQFMQQLLMAFGAIIGMNLTLLILPYVQNIQFFGKMELINSIVNTIIMITALMMTKDIITMVNGFVGGADAVGAGDGLKGQVKGALVSGITTAGKIGGAATVGVAKATLRGAQMANNFRRSVKDHGGLGHGGLKSAMRDSGAAAKARLKKTWDGAKAGIGKGWEFLKDEVFHPVGAYFGRPPKERPKMATGDATADETAAWQKDKAEAVAAAETEARTQAQQKFKGVKNKDQKKRLTDEYVAQARKAVEDEWGDGPSKDYLAKRRQAVYDSEMAAYDASRSPEDLAREERMLARRGYRMNDEGKFVDKDGKAVSRYEALDASKSTYQKFWDNATLSQAGKHFADGFLKGITDIGSQFSLDKMLGGAKGIFEGGLTFKGGIFDPKDKPKEGDKLTADLHAQAESKASLRHQQTQDQNATIIKLLTELSTSSSTQAKALERLAGKFTPTSGKKTP